MHLKAILIDDELHNLENLRILLTKYCPQISVVGLAQQKQQALDLIANQQPDVLFLDVEMPEATGFELLNLLPNQHDLEVIFVTAFHQYALEAIKFSALDYLLKPVKIEELQEAVHKLANKQAERNQSARMENMLANFNRDDQAKKIAITTSDRIDFVRLSDIQYCKSDSNYTTFCLKEGSSILASQTLKNFERLLQDYAFFRVHQSYLINLRFVKSILRKEGGYVLMQNGDELPISRMKKEALVNALGELKS